MAATSPNSQTAPGAIRLHAVGKMYRLYRRPSDKVLDALGIGGLLPWRGNTYREFWALRDLELDVRRGERLGIIGRNGAGKSTLLKIITGNVAATEGSVSVSGRVQALLELGTGFHPEFTGRQNIRASLSYQGMTAGRIRAKEEEIIDFSELEDFIEQPVKTYSAGMYARLAFSTATAIEPEVLIIDEVLGAGDAYFAGKCVERMKRLTEESGATVLFVSHDLGSVQQLCERVIWVDRGRITMDGAPLDVTKAYYASILAQEEIRLRARNARLGRRQFSQLQTRESAEGIREVLLRLVPESGRLSRSHPVARIILRNMTAFREEIVVGAPMDDDASQACYLMTDRKYMLWSEPLMAGPQRVRSVTDTGGAYGHAPFVFAVPVHVWADGSFELDLCHAAEPGDQLRVELFEEDAYRLLGVLTPSPGEFTTEVFSLKSQHGQAAEGVPQARAARPSDSAMTGEVILKQRQRDKFYSEFAEFHEIYTADETARKQVIYEVGESVTVVVELEVTRAIPACEFALSIYTLSDVVVAILSWPIEGGLAIGRHRLEVQINAPNLRQNAYLLSAALIREIHEATNEDLVYFSRWNRAVTFRVDEGFVGSAPRGLVQLTTIPPTGEALRSANAPGVEVSH